MAYFKISTDKKGKLKAKIQALGRDPETDKQKVCYKLVKNDNDLTPAKFHKYVEKCAIEFEEELAKAYDITTAPVLIVPTEDGVDLYRNVSEIIGFIG